MKKYNKDLNRFSLHLIKLLCIFGMICITGCHEDEVELSVSKLSIPFSGDKQSFTITSNIGWTVSSDVPWLTLSPTSGSKNGTISVTTEANKTTSQQTAVITVNGGDVTRIIVVTQVAAPPTTTVSTNSLSFLHSGEEKTFSVESNTDWTISYDESSWFTVSPTNGSNNSTVKITARENTTIDERTGIINVNTGDNTQTVNLIQTGVPLYLKVSTTSISVAAIKNSNAMYPFNIESNTSWNIKKGSETWFSVSPTSGSNDSRVNITAQDNPATEERTANITVSGGGIERIVNVKQSAVSLAVSTNSLTFPGAGGKNTFNISASTSLLDWTVTSSSTAWLTVSPASGSFNGTVTVTALANTSADERTGTITVSGGGITQTINVKQEKVLSLNVSSASLVFTYAAGTRTFNITSNTNWTVDKGSASWLTVSPTSGSNSNTISVSAEANDSYYERSAIITISGGGLTRTVNVTQSVAELYLSKYSLYFTPRGESNEVDITSNVSWTVNKGSATWLTVSPTSGSNNRTLTVTAAANSSTTDREATITISGGGQTTSISVSQGKAFAGPGTVSFWVNKDYGCGNISVTLTGYGTKTITGFYSSGMPSCNANYTASFTNVPIGTYTYNATCSGGRKWSGTVTVDSSCNRVLLFSL